MFAGIHAQNIPAEVSLSEFAYCFSPLVEETSDDTVVIDVEGCALRFGSAYELANAVARQALKSKTEGGLEIKVNVALAANPDVAIHAAKFCKGITFTAPGEELICLGSLPLKTLQFALTGIEESRASEIFETLRLWGVHTFKEFAELPLTGVSERLGQDGLKLQNLAAGKTERHLKLRSAQPVFEGSIELEYPIAELEPLSFLLSRLLNQICASLNSFALATNVLQVQLKLERGGPHEINLNLPYPMRDQKVFLKLLLLNLEMQPPCSAVMAIAIDCEPVKPRVLQTGLFIPLAPEPEKLELTLARLAKLVGPGNIGSPELLDTYRPDAFRVKRFVLEEAKRGKRKQNTEFRRQKTVGANPTFEIRNQRSSLGFRRFRPPLRALVQAERGCPREINAWDKNKSLHGKVVRVSGPWRKSGDWWRSDAWARDEWDVAVECGSNTQPIQTLCRIYREVGRDEWFVEGIYD